MLKEEKIVDENFEFDKVYTFTNEKLTNLLFPLNSNEIDIPRLAIFRLKIRNDFGAMWLSDYIDNGYLKDLQV